MKSTNFLKLIALILTLVMAFTSCSLIENIEGLNGIFGNPEPDGPVEEPTDPPADDPTVDPGDDPTVDPGDDPTVDPGDDPTVDPGDDPTVDPGDDPTVDPGDDPTVDPGDNPTDDPFEDNTDYPPEGTYQVALDSYRPLTKIPEFKGYNFTEINGNKPYFLRADLSNISYEYYSALDSLGRCGITVACVGIDLFPTDDRGSISSVDPSGWIQAEYSGSIVTGGYIWNRSHLIGWQLTGENANKQNLVTGTPYFNQRGMIIFENMVRDYIEETGNHVLYRVVPVFVGDELVCRGVTIEAYSIEDNGGNDTPESGDGICFNVFVHNVNEGIIIDYATGSTSLDPNYELPEPDDEIPENLTFIINKNGYMIHVWDCSSVKKMNEENKIYSTMTLEEIIAELEAQGRKYSLCKNCNPS